MFCSGKLYYDLWQEREARGIKDTVLVRIEQLAPFPFDKVADEISRYPNTEKLVWAQEEPKNNGAYFFVAPRIRTATRQILNKVRWRTDLGPACLMCSPCILCFVSFRSTHHNQSTHAQEFTPIYVGRAPAAAPATGLAKIHEKEQKGICESVFTV